MKSKFKWAAAILTALAAAVFLWLMASRSTNDQPVRKSIQLRTQLAAESATELRQLNAADVIRPTSTLQVWAENRRNSLNHFEFVAKALKAIEAGDGAAAYEIAFVLLECGTSLRRVKSETNLKANLRAQVEQTRQSPPVRTPEPWEIRRGEVTLERCSSLVGRNPFEAIDCKLSCYDFRYWVDRAVELGDPEAKLDRASQLIASLERKSAMEEKRKDFETTQQYIEEAMRSGNARAIFGIGTTFVDFSRSADPQRGVVLQLAACELGFGCKGSVFRRDSCDMPNDARPATCEYYDMRDNLRRDLGEAEYGRVYTRALEVVDLIRREDWEALKPYTRIDGSLNKKYGR